MDFVRRCKAVFQQLPPGGNVRSGSTNPLQADPVLTFAPIMR